MINLLCYIIKNLFLSWLSLVFFSCLQAEIFCPNYDYIPYACTETILNPPGAFILVWIHDTLGGFWFWKYLAVFLGFLCISLELQEGFSYFASVVETRENRRIEQSVLFICNKH